MMLGKETPIPLVLNVKAMARGFAAKETKKSKHTEMSYIASQCKQGNFKEFIPIYCAKVKLNIKI